MIVLLVPVLINLGWSRREGSLLRQGRKRAVRASRVESQAQPCRFARCRLSSWSGIERVPARHTLLWNRRAGFAYSEAAHPTCPAVRFRVLMRRCRQWQTVSRDRWRRRHDRRRRRSRRRDRVLRSGRQREKASRTSCTCRHSSCRSRRRDRRSLRDSHRCMTLCIRSRWLLGR